MMLNPPKQWELWYADVSFDEFEVLWKTRPVIVLERGDEPDTWFVVYVTSKVAKYRHRGDAVVLDWLHESLKVPSVALCYEVFEVAEDDFGRYIGCLTGADIDRVYDLVYGDGEQSR